jgi:dTDP-glucose 4,6-dehydratase
MIENFIAIYVLLDDTMLEIGYKEPVNRKSSYSKLIAVALMATKYFHDNIDSTIDESLITYVSDRKGHDRRYGIDPTKIREDLGWFPETKFEDGIKMTIEWYLQNKEWMESITSGEYQNYYEKMYSNRI